MHFLTMHHSCGWFVQVGQWRHREFTTAKGAVETVAGAIQRKKWPLLIWQCLACVALDIRVGNDSQQHQ